MESSERLEGSPKLTETFVNAAVFAADVVQIELRTLTKRNVEKEREKRINAPLDERCRKRGVERRPSAIRFSALDILKKMKKRLVLIRRDLLTKNLEHCR